MRLPFKKCTMSPTDCDETHEYWDCLSQDMQCHSLPVGHRKRCDEASFHIMCNVTHSLLVMKIMGWDCLPHNVQCHWLPVDQRKSCEIAFHRACNGTNFLLVIGLMWWDCFQKMCNATCLLLVIWIEGVMKLPFWRCTMSLTPCWSQEKCVEIEQKMCNVTHSLSVIEKGVMILPFI